jgi:hypothetical protein
MKMRMDEKIQMKWITINIDWLFWLRNYELIGIMIVKNGQL